MAAGGRIGSATRGNGLRALLVEDSTLIAENLCATLSESAAVDIVATARSQHEACAWMDSRINGCDVAIIDIFLKEGDGLGVLRHIARYDHPPTRLVLTNYATDDMRSRCRALERTPYSTSRRRSKNSSHGSELVNI